MNRSDHRPHVAASDLDGTLLRSDGTISRRSRAALAQVQDTGALVVFVTGRPPRWMKPVADATGHRGVAICANGGLVYDMAEERVIEENPFEPDAAVRVIAALREALPEATFGIERAGGFAQEPTFPRHVEGALAMAPIEELVRDPFVKLLVRVDGQRADALLALARSALGDLATPTHSSLSGLVEISGAGVSKASALERLAAERGTGPDRVVAFGDMPNDLPMLAWAGHAVAVANAHPEVLAAADEVTASNEEDGLARVLERLFPSE